jgi:hypothetical protein
MRRLEAVLLLVVLTTMVGCDSGSKSCPDVSGQWTIASHCDASMVGETVDVTQSGCDITYASPFTGWTGSIDENGLMECTGTGGGQQLTCTGALAGNAIGLTCTPDPCAVALMR